MSGERARFLLPVFFAAAMAGLFILKYFQLPVLLLLSVLYLFWGYLEVAAILLILLFWLFLMPTRWPVLLVVLVLAIDFLVPFARDFDKNLSPTMGPTLKIVTYNWLGELDDRSEMYDWIAKEAPDILAIQEITGNEAGIAEALFKQFRFHTSPAPDLMIFSKFPILNEQITRIEEHSIVVASLDVEGRQVNVWGIHPSTLRSKSELAARNYYLTTLADLVPKDGEPIVMLGDFNATRWDPYFANLARRADLHEEPFLVPPPTRMGIRSGLPQVGSPIDHILTNRGNVLADCHTGPAMESDHRPLICSLTLAR